MRGTTDMAIVRPAEDLAVIAKRVAEREKKGRKDQLEHAKKQAIDVFAARQQAKRGEWAAWCQSAGLSGQRAWQYTELGKSLVTRDFSSLPEDEQWTRWQRISGNAGPEDDSPLSPPLNGSVNDCEILNDRPEPSKPPARTRHDDDEEEEADEEEEREPDEPEKFDAKFSVNKFRLVVTVAIEAATLNQKLFTDLIAHKKISSEMISDVKVVIGTWKKIARQLEDAQ